MNALEQSYVEALDKRDHARFVSCLCQGLNLRAYHSGRSLIELTLSKNLSGPMLNFFLNSAIIEPYKHEVLNWVAYYQPEHVSILLKRQASPNYQNNQGMTALMLAARDSKLKALKLLWESGASPYIRDKGNFGAFSIPAFYQEQGVLNFYLDNLTNLALCQEFSAQISEKNITLPEIMADRLEIVTNKYLFEHTIQSLSHVSQPKEHKVSKI